MMLNIVEIICYSCLGSDGGSNGGSDGDRVVFSRPTQEKLLYIHIMPHVHLNISQVGHLDFLLLSDVHT